MWLDELAIGAGMRLDVRDAVGSTNEEALAMARRGERGSVWIAAHHQTAGRGRRGRQWRSQPGNLFASLLLCDPSPAEFAAQLSFVAALAVHDAVRAVAPELAARFGLKWPNDVLFEGAKLAGILVEGELVGEGKLAAVVGIGVNCTNHPVDVDYPATDLAAAGAPVEPGRLLCALSRTMVARLTQWNRGAGFRHTRHDWLACAIGLGEALRVFIGERTILGQFETIDHSGRLVLSLPDGARETVAAGEAFPVGGIEAGRRIVPLTRERAQASQSATVSEAIDLQPAAASGAEPAK
jgi:BirA family biotin operon repressor/biotin-[acetyl-CoA-carboxylase] ligase